MIEVLPEVTVAPLAKVEIERPVADIKESDVDAMLESMRKQRVSYARRRTRCAEG